jgi:ribose/xylose/arabinose/galactoside ABC-type transport system permease subunit
MAPPPPNIRWSCWRLEAIVNNALISAGEYADSRDRAASLRARASPRILLLMLFIALVGAAITLRMPHFLSANSLLNLTRQSSVLAIVAFGATFVIVAGEIDLSVGAVVGLVAVLLASASVHGYSAPVMVLSGLAAGLVVGVVNGLLILKWRVPSFLATLGTLSIAKGLAMTISLDAVPIVNIGFVKFFRLSYGGLAMPVAIALILFVVALVLLNYSRFGIRTRAVGSNESAARLAGLNTVRHKYMVLILGSMFAAIGGIVLAGRTNLGLASSGTGLELDVIAAVILGGAHLGGGTGSIVGTILGATLLTMIFVGIATLGLPAPYQDIAKGALIGLAILIMRLQRH